MNAIGRYREDRGLSHEDMARELSARLGRDINPSGVKIWERRPKPPKDWIRVLDIPAADNGPPYKDSSLPPDEWGEGPSGPAGEARFREQDTEAPKAPAGAKVIPLHARSLSTSKDRIEKLYRTIGAAASMGTGNDGYAAVSNEMAPHIAEQWIKAAEVNPHVRTIVEFLDAGGPVGDLVIANLTLVLAFVYVSGRAPQLGFFFGRFGNYHTHAVRLAQEREAAEQGGVVVGSANGGYAQSPEGGMGDAPGEAFA